MTRLCKQGKNLIMHMVPIDDMYCQLVICTYLFIAEIYFTCLHIKVQPMEVEIEEKTGGGQTQWTLTQSTFMHTFLANLVADGTKTSTGFKKVHLNLCAKTLNDHFKLNRSSN
jgi:hypothetical protein